MTALSNLALGEFHQRKASIDAAVRANRYSRQDGERSLACWLAIALAAGVRPGECTAILADWQADHGYDDATARAVLLSGGPPREEWSAELTRARDRAASKARQHPTDDRLNARHWQLESLCIYLGCPPEASSDAGREASASLGFAAGAATGGRPLAAATENERKAA